ncbi:MAG: 2-isopropylmalate synthase [Gammaproteobacteria bacterium]|nr:2-isopropylmalate synthase [Gammaproteobacteria bacterium]
MNSYRNTYDHKKYQAFPTLHLPQRKWPNQQIIQAPTWCSVDLRDGNQALVNPLSVQQKLSLFIILLDIGFKEIEVGFPSASQDDFDFVRVLIEGQYIPNDVTISILTPARDTFIQRSFEALKGVKKAIIHLYNSTSKVQRNKVFNMDKTAVTQMAVHAAKLIKQYAHIQSETQWHFQYSPESFTATELEYAVTICNAVNTVWQPTEENPVILNLPATVEVSTPNIYADQIEWFIDHIEHRKNIIISVHTHNDRGSAIAAAEMALLAGADRVEGTLLGNGERTGNMDIITMAMNCYSQGIDPQLDLSNIQSLSDKVSQLIDIPIHPRHPYIGHFVYTAFSGSHQDAIRKCLASYQAGTQWDIAYLPIDPTDLGRSYEEVIRINSQSGKGGISYIIEQALATQIPRWLQVEFSQIVQQYTEQHSTEISSETLIDLFTAQYLKPNNIIHINQYNTTQIHTEKPTITEFMMSYMNKPLILNAQGVGILDCFITALAEQFDMTIEIIEYNEQTLEANNSAYAIAFVRLNIEADYFSGVAKNKDIVMASLNAILQAISDSL